VLSRTPRDALQVIWGKRWQLAALGAFVFAVGGLLAAGLSRLVTRPLRIVVAQAQRAAVGGGIVPLVRPGTREVADLSAALTRMTATLDERARYVTAFAASVSHEFKTPLAGLRGAAELLEDHGDTLPADERAKLLRVIAVSTKRLHQLVQRLLELARADMMRPGGTMQTPVAAVLDDLLPHYRARGMTIDADAGGAAVALSAEALAALLASLLDNAAAYASADGRGLGARVSIRASASRGRTRIEVADQGPGISPANRQNIFEPFFTTAREQGGTGVGLSIVRAIAVGGGGTVELGDTPSGACFRIELPSGIDR
jgi:signal transduction histidine kinase